MAGGLAGGGRAGGRESVCTNNQNDGLIGEMTTNVGNCHQLAIEALRTDTEACCSKVNERELKQSTKIFVAGDRVKSLQTDEIISSLSDEKLC